ncbi:hypothetical protein MRB53_039118 [Persea americana]|nr:hypothetical protein MRB53_039118 [Persea americana]
MMLQRDSDQRMLEIHDESETKFTLEGAGNQAAVAKRFAFIDSRDQPSLSSLGIVEPEESGSDEHATESSCIETVVNRRRIRVEDRDERLT